MKRRELLAFIGTGTLLGLAGCSSKGGVGEDDFMIDGMRALEIKTIHFDFDEYVIKPKYRRVLSAHAKKLNASGASIKIEGHCDERGTREYNIGLGERRANAVRSYMIAEGLAPAQISTISYGEERPLDYGHNESAWAKNRRAELVY